MTVNKFNKKYLLRKSFDTYQGGASNETFTLKKELVYGEKKGDFQENKYKVSVRQNGKYLEIKIDDNGANTIIKKVPIGKEQEVLNSFYGKYSDSICATKVYTYNPSVFKDVESAKVVAKTIKRKKPLKEEASKKTSQEIIDEKNFNKLMKVSPEIAKILKDTKLFKENGFYYDEKTGNIKVPEGLRNPYAKEQILRFINLTGWLDSPKAINLEKTNKNKYRILKIEKYKELMDFNKDLIGLPRLVLKYRYINSIYNDILDDGFILRKKSDGNYDIFNPKTNKISNGQYHKSILNEKNIRTFDLELAVLSSITSSPEYVKNGLITQSHTIQQMLENNGIKGEHGEKILPSKMLELDWKRIKNEIESKMSIEKSKNNQRYQELSYLKTFIENKDYLKVEKNTKLYGEINENNKANNIMNSLSDLEGADEQTITQKITGIMKELSIPLGMLGLLLSILPWTRKIGLPLLGIAVGGYVAGKVLPAVEKRVGLSADKLGIIQQNKRIYEASDKVKEDYGDKIMEIQQINLNNKNEIYDEKNSKLPAIKDGKVLKNIAEDIIKRNLDVKPTITSEKLFNELSVKNNKYTQKDVEVFLEIINSKKFSHDEEDKTIIDYLTDGIDILNQPYKSPTFTGISKIDKNINVELKKKWNEGEGDKKRENRKNILEIQTAINKELSTVSNILDASKTFFNNLWEKTGGDNKIKEYKNFDIGNKVSNIISKIDTIDEDISNLIKPNLESYKTYIELEKKLAPLEGIIDRNWEDAKVGVFNIIGIVSNETEKAGYSRVNSFADKNITEIKNIITDCGNKEELKEIKERAKKILLGLENLKKETNEKMGVKDEVLKSDKISEQILENNSNTYAEHFTKISGAVEILSEIDKLEEENIKLEDLEGHFEKIEEAQKVLKEYDSAYKDIKINTDGSLFINLTTTIVNDKFNSGDTVKKILDRLTKYRTLKDTRKTKLEKPLKEFYTKNNEKLNKLKTINSTSNFEDDLKVLAKVKEYLAKKGIELNREEKDILKELEKNRKTALETLKKLKEKATEENKTTEEIGKIDKAIEVLTEDLPKFANSSWNNTKEFFNSVGDVFGNALDEINSISFDLETLKSTTVSLISSSKDNIKDIVKNKDYDTQAKKALAEGKKVFGTNFLNSVSDKTTLKNVADKYRNKQEAVKTKAEARLTQIEGEVSRLTNKEEFKKRYKEVKKIGELFPDLEGKVETIRKLIFNSYISITKANERLFSGSFNKDKEVIKGYRDGSSDKKIKDVFTDLYDYVDSLNLNELTIFEVYSEVNTISNKIIAKKDSSGQQLFNTEELKTVKKFKEKIFSNIDRYSL